MRNVINRGLLVVSLVKGVLLLLFRERFIRVVFISLMIIRMILWILWFVTEVGVISFWWLYIKVRMDIDGNFCIFCLLGILWFLLNIGFWICEFFRKRFKVLVIYSYLVWYGFGV